jgi:hypothetical protein
LLKDTRSASSPFAVYLIISALRRFVTSFGHENPRYSSPTTCAERASHAPMTIRSGFMKSATADPSRRNSGFMQRPNSPTGRPAAVSRARRTTVSVVPGTTVLFTTTTW